SLGIYNEVRCASTRSSFGYRPSESKDVKRTDAVGLGPHANCAGACYMLVLEIDVRFSVKRYRDSSAAKVHAQHVPYVACNGCGNILDRVSSATRGVVERDIVLKRVGARNVVVITIFPSPDESACLILLTRDRLELHLDHPVG